MTPICTFFPNTLYIVVYMSIVKMLCCSIGLYPTYANKDINIVKLYIICSKTESHNRSCSRSNCY